MAGTYRSFVKRLFIILNSITAFVFLLTCLIPYLNQEKWWPVSILGLGTGILVALLILFLVFWIIIKPRYVFISLIPLLVGWKNITSIFAFNTPSKFTYNKPKDVLRVVSWNVARFTEWKRNNNKGSQTRLKMMDLIKEQNADVLCLQEFFHSDDSIYYDNLNHVMKKLGYPYFYYSWDDDGHLQWVGQAIFSRYPIIDSGMVRYPRPSMPEALIHADIVFNKDTVRFYTTHLQSFKFKKDDYERIEKIKSREDSLLYNSANLFSKFKRAITLRSRQADIVKDIVRNSPHPYILTGDFNDIPNSYTYFTIRRNLQDAFLKEGFGVGRTFTGLAPTLRIDYILSTNDFKVNQFNRLVKNYSDHYMLVADFKIKE